MSREPGAHDGDRASPRSSTGFLAVVEEVGRRDQRARRGHRHRPPRHHLARRGDRRTSTRAPSRSTARCTSARSPTRSWIDALQADTASDAPAPHDGRGAARRSCCSSLGSRRTWPTRRWITNQYDRYVLGNTALSYPDDGGMVRVDEESGLGFAVATDANGRYCSSTRTRARSSRSPRRTATSPSPARRPSASRDCLNFGSPENPEVMWQFSAGRRGPGRRMPRARHPRHRRQRQSFYNQTGDVPIHPTPVVAVLGVIDDVARRIPSGWQDDGHNIYLLGDTSARARRLGLGRRRARPPRRAPAGRRPRAREGARRAARRGRASRASSTRRTTSPTAASPAALAEAVAALRRRRARRGSTSCIQRRRHRRRDRAVLASRPAACSCRCRARTT